MTINIRLLILVTACIGLSACGGNSDSGAELAQDRTASECVEFNTGTITNLCNFAIIVRTFGGTSTPVSVPANATVIDPDPDVIADFAACEAPFTPVELTATTFDCV